MGKTKRPTKDDAGIVRVGAYCRYSEGPGQDDGSIEAQHMAIDAEVRRNPSWRVTYHDEPKRSAFVEDIRKRPVFQALMKAAVAGEYDMVLVHRVDRWSRIANVT